MGIQILTSTLKEQSVLKAPSSIVVITSNLFKERGYRTIKDILVDVEGFNDVAPLPREGTTLEFALTFKY